MIKVGNRKIFLGTCGWKFRDWHGSFYPDELTTSEYLKYYSRYFDSVEIEETFFGRPKTEKVLQWHQQTPENFKFSIKLNRQITHERRFKDCQSLFLKFCEAIALLKDKLGVVLIQLPTNFQQKNISDMIQLLDRDYQEQFKIAIDFSNQIWKKTEAPAFFKAKNLSVVQTDLNTIEEPRGDFLYFRWLGSQEYNTFSVEQQDCSENLNIWKLRFSQLPARIKTIYGYFSNHYSGYAPSNCLQFKKLLTNTEKYSL